MYHGNYRMLRRTLRFGWLDFASPAQRGSETKLKVEVKRFKWKGAK